MFEWPNRLLLIIALLSVLLYTFQGADVSVETVSVDRERMLSYLNRQAEILGQEALDRISTREKLVAEKDRLRSEFRFMIGLEPLPPRSPLKVTRVRVIEREGYTVETLHYAIPWVRAGYICLIIDPIQVAEVFGVHRGTHSNDMRDWYCRGYTPIGIEVWNAMRAVDYLLTRPDVDGKRLTINGVSGGGHLSWMTGAVDDRLAVVQPVAGTADVQAHVQLDLQARHCDCAYFINTYRHDWTTLAALIAPRPLLLHNSSEDPYYPPEGYQRVFKRVQSLYGLSGAAEKAGIFEVPGRHDYTQAEREKAVEWSEWWLRGERAKITERPFDKIPGAQLSAFGGDLPNTSIY